MVGDRNSESMLVMWWDIFVLPIYKHYQQMEGVSVPNSGMPLMYMRCGGIFSYSLYISIEYTLKVGTRFGPYFATMA